jgi:hypothetical protein
MDKFFNVLEKRSSPPKPIAIRMKYSDFLSTQAGVIPTATNTKPSDNVNVPATVSKSSAAVSIQSVAKKSRSVSDSSNEVDK